MNSRADARRGAQSTANRGGGAQKSGSFRVKIRFFIRH
jgi:hypothetical protein